MTRIKFLCEICFGIRWRGGKGRVYISVLPAIIICTGISDRIDVHTYTSNFCDRYTIAPALQSERMDAIDTSMLQVIAYKSIGP